ncbi:hypothetical protein ACIQBJ_13825 [Kitasatospora sp. NPDC088391]|uniref:VMAP-C domain-containing protein n=1 Tax=Kitasatospora sp. NPDC088391 TaxID=3364074 RepID=UPI0038187A86
MDARRLALIRSGAAVGDPVGLGSGYLIAPRLVLTARHVVTEKETGVRRPRIKVWIGHVRDGGTKASGVAEAWLHPDLDVALLLLDRDHEVPDPVRWGRPVGRDPLPYQGLGYPAASTVDGAGREVEREVEHLRGTLPPLSGGGGRYVLDQDTVPDPRPGDRVLWSGASGAAVFCEGHLVCVVVQERRSFGSGRLLACPAHVFLADGFFTAALDQYAGGPPPLAEIGAALPPERPAAQYSGWEREVEQTLWQCLPGADACAAQYRALAAAFGYRVPTGEQPSIGRLLALAGVHPRGLATLSGTLAEALADPERRADLARLLQRDRVLRGAPLLSLGEHQRLLDLLGWVAELSPALLAHASREALRHAVLPAALSRPGPAADDLDGIVTGLEDLPADDPGPDGTPPVPALVKVVEYAAAAVTDPVLAGELRAWTDEVARRTGIHPTALGERRGDARRWADRAPSPVTRVELELTAAAPAGADGAADGQRYTCRVLLARQDGSRTVLHEPETVLRTPEEVARRLRDEVRAAAARGDLAADAPWVTVLVDREGLGLAVDEWNPGAPNPLLPGRPIGAEYRVTLSCPEIGDLVESRADDLRRRWEHGRSATLVVGPETATEAQLHSLLDTGHRDTARVVLHGPPERRTTMLTYCLALGVPVVLWDRQAAGHADADRLRPLEPTGPLPELPERVRAFRNRPAPDPARPALLWESVDGRPKTAPLQLTDPRKGTHTG